MSGALAHDMSAFSGEDRVQLDWLNEDLPGNRDGESDEETRGDTESNRQADHMDASSGYNQSKHATVEAASKRSLEERIRYGFIHTYKPVMDDATCRSFVAWKTTVVGVKRIFLRG